MEPPREDECARSTEGGTKAVPARGSGTRGCNRGPTTPPGVPGTPRSSASVRRRPQRSFYGPLQLRPLQFLHVHVCRAATRVGGEAASSNQYDPFSSHRCQ